MCNGSISDSSFLNTTCNTMMIVELLQSESITISSSSSVQEISVYVHFNTDLQMINREENEWNVLAHHLHTSKCSWVWGWQMFLRGLPYTCYSTLAKFLLACKYWWSWWCWQCWWQRLCWWQTLSRVLSCKNLLGAQNIENGWENCHKRVLIW